MNLPELIEHARRNGAGSLRDMEQRATLRGTPISKSTLGDFANGKKDDQPPSADVRAALANALDVSVGQVTAAIVESYAPGLSTVDSESPEHAKAWLLLTEGRSPEEIEHLLTVAREIVKTLDSVRHRPSAE